MTELDDLYESYGQSPWLEGVTNEWLNDDTLLDFVSQGVRGAMLTTGGYARALTATQPQHSPEDLDVEERFERLLINDVQRTCDVLSDIYVSGCEDVDNATRRHGDGFATYELSPRLAHDDEAMIAAALKSSDALHRDNAMVSIPATDEGLTAITALLGAGRNVQATSIFSLERYGDVLEAWISGLEEAESNGHDLRRIASVASLDVAAIDVVIDSLLVATDPRRGTAAVSLCAGIYEHYRSFVSAKRAFALLGRGAQVQRLAWTNSAPSNRAYFDLLYVDFLVGAETVAAMSDVTVAKVLDHANFTNSLLVNKRTIRKAAVIVKELPRVIVREAVAQKLERDALSESLRAYDEILTALSAEPDS